MEKYRVKPGQTFGLARLIAGSTVELTEEEAAGFLDKLELVEGGMDAPADETPQPSLQASLKNDLGAEIDPSLKLIPDDIDVDDETPKKAVRKTLRKPKGAG